MLFGSPPPHYYQQYSFQQKIQHLQRTYLDKTAHPSPIIVTLVQTYQNYFNIRPPSLSPPLPDGR